MIPDSGNVGLIVKATAGFYYVQYGGSRVECRARGIFRREGVSPLVGDRAEISVRPGDPPQGTVERILPRRNRLTRPAVANVDRLVVVASAADPAPVLFTLDQLTAIALHAGIEPVMVFTKADLGPAGEFVALYRKARLRAFAVSSRTGQGVEEFRGALGAGMNVFTGNSGVGKSSLLNRLCPELSLATGEVSRRLGRGRHTTRVVELFRLGGPDVWAADTPGFSSLDFEQGQIIRREELPGVFPEFAPYLGRCRYDDCTHVCEPGCAVLRAVAAGRIPASRHESYRRMMAQARTLKEWELPPRSSWPGGRHGKG